MPLVYEVAEHKKDAHKYIVITGFEGSVSALVVPDEIDGLPVEAVGNHAFSGRDDIVTASLPGSIKTLYGFAFHNCRNLKKIFLHDSIDDYYDGVCRQCDSLTDIEMVMDRGWYEVVRNFLADNDRTLRFLLRVKGDKPENENDVAEIISCLTFPEYVYDFNENTMARTIQFSIAGSGMFYRECVDRRSIDYRQYDKLFEKAVIDGGEIAENIAIGRLLYPLELSEDSRGMYEDFVRNNAQSILLRLIEATGKEPENKETIKALLEYDRKVAALLPGEETAIVGAAAIDAGLKLATDRQYTEVCAILMGSGGRAHCDVMGAFEL